MNYFYLGTGHLPPLLSCELVVVPVKVRSEIDIHACCPLSPSHTSRTGAVSSTPTTVPINSWRILWACIPSLVLPPFFFFSPPPAPPLVDTSASGGAGPMNRDGQTSSRSLPRQLERSRIWYTTHPNFFVKQRAGEGEGEWWCWGGSLIAGSELTFRLQVEFPELANRVNRWVAPVPREYHRLTQQRFKNGWRGLPFRLISGYWRRTRWNIHRGHLHGW